MLLNYKIFEIQGSSSRNLRTVRSHALVTKIFHTLLSPRSWKQNLPVTQQTNIELHWFYHVFLWTAVYLKPSHASSGTAAFSKRLNTWNLVFSLHVLVSSSSCSTVPCSKAYQLSQALLHWSFPREHKWGCGVLQLFQAFLLAQPFMWQQKR